MHLEEMEKERQKAEKLEKKKHDKMIKTAQMQVCVDQMMCIHKNDVFAFSLHTRLPSYVYGHLLFYSICYILLRDCVLAW